jgi:hypothetical protein
MDGRHPGHPTTEPGSTIGRPTTRARPDASWQARDRFPSETAIRPFTWDTTAGLASLPWSTAAQPLLYGCRAVGLGWLAVAVGQAQQHLQFLGAAPGG